MRCRLAILIFLISCAVIERAVDLYNLLLHPQSFMVTLGFRPDIREGGLYVYVGSISPKDLSGNPNPAYESGLRVGDRIVSLSTSRGGRKEIRGFFDVGSVLSKSEPREALTMEIHRDSKSGSSQDLMVSLPRDRRNPAGILILWVLVIIIPITAIITSSVVGLMKPEDENAFVAS